MLEGLVAWVLNTYLGEYVENLNTDQLTIGIFQGHVELENLPLKRSALKSLGLPIEVKSGFIGRIQLQVPVRRLKSEQWIITIEKLYLVAGPDRTQEYDKAAEDKQAQEKKKVQLAELEDNFKVQKELLQQNSTVNRGNSWWSYGTSFVTNIVDNLQLKVLDVHLRYEDDLTIPGNCFSCGVTIKSVSAQSADTNWLPGFVNRSASNQIFKIVDLQEFSLYWDSDVKLIGGVSRTDLQEALEMRSVDVDSPQVHDYILEPVSGSAKFQRNTSSLPLRRRETPRVLMDIELDKFPLSLNNVQFHGLVAMMKEIDRHKKRCRYKKFRPMCSVKEDCKKWWKFAIDSAFFVIKEQRFSSSREFQCKRARDNVLYTKAYRNWLELGPKYTAKADKDMMNAFESDVTFGELKLLRFIVTDQLLEKERAMASTRTVEQLHGQTVEQEDESAQQGLLQRWFPGWTGWYGSTSSNSSSIEEVSPSQTPDENSSRTSEVSKSEFDQDIAEVLSDSTNDNSLMMLDVVFARINFCLHTGVLKLFSAPLHSSTDVTKKVECLLELECSGIEMNFESRSRTNGWMFAVSMVDLLLQDKMTSGSLRPTLVAPLYKERKEITDKLFKCVFEKKPFSTKADYKLAVTSQPLDIVYNPAAIRKVKEIFTVDKSLCQSAEVELELAAAAKNRYKVLKRQTQQELKQTFDAVLEGDIQAKAKRWIFDVDMFAPHITIPEYFQEGNSTLVVFDLGHLRVCNRTSETQTSKQDLPDDDMDEFVTPSSTPTNEPETDDKSTMCTKEATSEENVGLSLTESVIREKLYEAYVIILSDLKVMVGKTNDNWKTVFNKKTSLQHVVDSFSISLQFERRLLHTSHPEWPNASLCGIIPSIVLHVNDHKVSALRICAMLLSQNFGASDSDPASDPVSDPSFRPGKKKKVPTATLR